MLVNTELCKFATCKVRLLLAETINRGMPARLLGAFRPLEVWVVVAPSPRCTARDVDTGVSVLEL